MVSEGKIGLTIVDSDIAQLNKTYYGDLDITLQVSFPQRASWGVSPKNAWLADSINDWIKGERPQSTQSWLLKRYFELSKSEPSVANFKFKDGRISPYDEIFKKYAAEIGWDWRLLASQGFSESRFDTTVVSWAGARGIMQIMPSTARAFGLEADRIANPEANIATAVKILKSLNRSLQKYVPDDVERQKFIVAAYNSGIAHVYDAIALAQKYGKNPQLWDGNVAETILMKSKPEFYNDSVCKYGYFRGKQTVTYVAQVMNFYEKSKKEIK
jgi:membrane-bound lytic murein transglycosylase F